jgi:hypothetical protein
VSNERFSNITTTWSSAFLGSAWSLHIPDHADKDAFHTTFTLSRRTPHT